MFLKSIPYACFLLEEGPWMDIFVFKRYGRLFMIREAKWKKLVPMNEKEKFCLEMLDKNHWNNWYHIASRNNLFLLAFHLIRFQLTCNLDNHDYAHVYKWIIYNWIRFFENIRRYQTARKAQFPQRLISIDRLDLSQIARMISLNVRLKARRDAKKKEKKKGCWNSWKRRDPIFSPLGHARVEGVAIAKKKKKNLLTLLSWPIVT